MTRGDARVKGPGERERSNDRDEISRFILKVGKIVPPTTDVVD